MRIFGPRSEAWGLPPNHCLQPTGRPAHQVGQRIDEPPCG